MIIPIGARRLMTYRRLPEGEVSDISKGRSNADQRGITADELNGFRRKVCAYLWLVIGTFLTLENSISRETIHLTRAKT